VEAVDLTPVGFKGFRGVWTWMWPRPDLTEHVYQAGRDQNPVSAKPCGSEGIGT
jgi:hypothetical protein